MNILKTISLAWIIVWLGIPAYAQEKTKEFREDYSYFAYYDAKKGTWGEWQEGNNTFVFNAFSNNDIVLYSASGKKEVYRRVSDIEDGIDNEGQKYQVSTILAEKGSEYYLFLFGETRTIILADKWGNKFQFQK